MIVIGKVRGIFDRSTKIRLLFLLTAIIAGGLLETMTLALVVPFVSVLTDSSIIYTNEYLVWVNNFFGFSTVGSFLAMLAFLLAAVFVLRNIYHFTLIRIKARFNARRQAILSERLLNKILDFSYLYHADRNIAELQSIALDDVRKLFGLTGTTLSMVMDFFNTLFIITLLVIVSPLMTFIVAIMVLLCVFLYLKVFRRRIRTLGIKNRQARIEIKKAFHQALGGIKEVKVMKRESYFSRVFKSRNDVFVDTDVKVQTINAIPGLMIETVCFGGAFILLGIFILGGVDIAGLIPQFTVFTIAAFRLIPAISRQMSHVNAILHGLPSVDAVYASLFETKDVVPKALSDIEKVDMIDTINDIVVQDLAFKYPRIPDSVLHDVSLIIPVKKSVAFIGPSGAGKTTLADLILGILTPDEGGVFWQGKSIHHHISEWSSKVGYIPQQIYLLDESIRENVAFGIERKCINEDKVWCALAQAQLKDFIESLPEGLDTVVGERGVRLSGGQRQRIGIARAMYEDPPILVLDEATSSLDNDTEKAVMEAIMGFAGNKTMIIVAHRLSTIEHCDIVYRVENKTVVRER